MKVRVPEGVSFYPDVVIGCGDPVYLDLTEDVLLNPVLIVEVLSPSTEAFDRGRRFEFYRTIPSLKAYLSIAQDRVRVDLYLREGESPDRWVLVSASSVRETVDMEPLGCQIPVAEIYRGVDFEG